MSERPFVFAVDFDGTLCENKWPEIGEPNLPLIDFLKRKQEEGKKVILYTMREGEMLEKAEEWLFENFEFMPDASNDNVKELQEYFGNNPRKIFADVYIDDHNAKYGVCAELPYYRMGLPERVKVYQDKIWERGIGLDEK